MQQRRRATFDFAELAVVLSHYDLGAVESITEFEKGSRRSPKVGIVSQRGKFLLKRLAEERAQVERVRFAHRLQSCLYEADFPLARLVPTRERGQTLLQIRDRMYELFEFIAGEPYRATPSESEDAGVVLARFHLAAGRLSPTEVSPPAGSRGNYHTSLGVRTGLCSIGSLLSSHDSLAGNEAELSELVQDLLGAYDRAGAAVDRLAGPKSPERIIHSDWHPGNLLFRDYEVVAVVDYDAARHARPIIDVANGALQFSIVAGGNPSTWPDHLDEERYRAFVCGYASLCPLSDADRLAVVHLMIEALIAECVAPIARTGSVGQWTGFRVLKMVRRKVAWLAEHVEGLARAPSGGG